MLDAETKARIDSARDILVGKVPDPKSQVEQITIALIYKFMDDMDCQSQELGGKATFFTGEFKKHRWGHLLDRRLGGHERLLLYAEGIEKMNENAGIPQLFRDIFKGVFLPYRDPETLNLFLKEINGFSYDHSERLGDAYEYLLNILGTQGDAGQFRTPRHIIDFIVAIVDPKKHETVLDPACGTAGFLISAFKHILKANEDLSPDERGRLMTNFAGYDIAPDMVRLSRVNMYLHSFPNPTIHEYDTLTSEERWDDRYDIIMTNPPFMTPKGGIRPHNRFAIKAKRSEVLFVDYIAEHLNPGGRAGVIVPEGIIFQSQNAYKNLRRMLVENYLWAVVSLPAGVFNPYSGVKTSVLFLDKNLAKRTDNILFVKVTNDGFNLGAQRRPIEGSELPEALKILDGHKRAQKAQEGKIALTVSRDRLLESPDCNLSGERYREIAVRVNAKWPMVKLRDVCRINPPKSEFKDADQTLEVSFAPMSALSENRPSFAPTETRAIQDVINGYTYFRDNDVLLAKITPCFENGKAGIAGGLLHGIGFGSTEFIVLRPDEKSILSHLLYYFVASQGFRNRGIAHMTGSAGQQRLPMSFVESYEIPLPPLEEQERMVAELDGYRKVIEGAHQVVENYKPSIHIDPEWEMVKLGEVCDIKSGGTPSRSNKPFWNGDIPWVGSTVCKDEEVTKAEEYITKEGLKNSAAKLFASGTTLIALVGATIGKTGLLKFDSTTNQNIAGLYPNSLTVLDPIFLFYAARTLYPEFLKLAEGKFRMANLSFVREQEIPLPPLDKQREIVAELETERAIVESNRRLIDIFKNKIQVKLDEVWGEETAGLAEVNPEKGGNDG